MCLPKACAELVEARNLPYNLGDAPLGPEGKV
jgi:hypothetical protein